MSKNDYLDFRDKFIAHASMTGMPSNICHASMAGMPSDVQRRGPAYGGNWDTVRKVINKAPTSVNNRAAASTLQSGYLGDLNKKMQTMVSTGKRAKQSNAESARFLDSLNNYNAVVNAARGEGNNVKFKKASVKYRDIGGTLAVYDCTLTDTDTNPGVQSWS